MKNRSKRINPYLTDIGTVVFVLLSVVLTITFFNFIGCKGRSGKSAGPNLLLITIEGLRGDIAGPKVPKPMEMPVLDRIWKEGKVLTRFIVASPTRTSSLASMFTGLYPMRHGVRNDRADQLPEDVTTLAEALRKAGWRTGAVVSNVDTVTASGLAQGFDYYDDSFIPPVDEIGLPRRRWAPVTKANNVTTRAITWIKTVATDKEKAPWFLWVEYSDALPPRNPPPPFSYLYPKDSYSAELSFVDANLGVLLAKVKDMGLADNTLLVITSAHGLPLGEHGESITSIFAYFNTVSVPAVFVFPGNVPPNREESKILRSVDLTPTIMGLMDLSPPKRIDGKDISKVIRGDANCEEETAYVENMYLKFWFDWRPVRSIIAGNLHYLDIDPPELYDIKNDPKEENNIADRLMADTERMKNEMNILLERTKRGKSAGEDTVESEVEAKLKRLGYLPDSIKKTGTMAHLSKGKIIAFVTMIRSIIEERKERKPAQSVENFRKIIEKYPDSPYVSYLLAAALMKSGSTGEEIEKLLGRALAGGSRYIRAAAMVKLARLSVTGKQLIEAENLLKLSARLVPNNPAIYNELGRVYVEQRLDLEAEKAFRKSIEIEPKFYKARFRLAVLYANERERNPAAMQELVKVLEYNPDFIPAHFMIAKIAAEFYRNKEQARKHLKKVIELNPEGAAAEEAQILLEKLEIP